MAILGDDTPVFFVTYIPIFGGVARTCSRLNVGKKVTPLMGTT